MAAMRDRLVWGVVAVSILGVCLSVFSGAAAIVEQGQFVVTYMGGGLRIIALLGLTLFTIFFVRRSFDSRDVEFLLTRPISRPVFVGSHILAFSILAAGVGAFIAAVTGLLSIHFGGGQSVMMWSFGVAVELMVVTNTAFFFAMVLSSPVTAGLATFGFYILARLMGQLLAIFNHAPTPSGIQEYAMYGLGQIVHVIAIVIPRLDLMVQTSWLIYGGGALSDWLFAVVQGAAFLLLIGVATLIDLRRRQF